MATCGEQDSLAVARVGGKEGGRRRGEGWGAGRRGADVRLTVAADARLLATPATTVSSIERWMEIQKEKGICELGSLPRPCSSSPARWRPSTICGGNAGLARAVDNAAREAETDGH
jgi:hypothetical protein